jgi:hypothetical protein
MVSNRYPNNYKHGIVVRYNWMFYLTKVAHIYNIFINSLNFNNKVFEVLNHKK